MGIIAGFVVPHPPIIVAEVGKGEEKKVGKTITSYQEVARCIRDLKPETIILSSPHDVAYSDYFQIAKGPKGNASLSRFGAPGVRFEVNYDEELVKKIESLCEDESFPAGTLGDQGENFTEDHGSMVPLYFINQFYTDYKLVRIGLSGLSLADHYHLGILLQKACEALGRRVVYVASGDMSHCQKEDGPYGYKKEGPEYDARLMDILGRGDFLSLLDFDPVLMEKAEMCGHPSFTMMAGALDRKAVDIKVYSHQNDFGVGYGIVSYLVKGDDPKRNFLDQYLSQEQAAIEKKKQDADPYVRLARAEVEAYVLSKRLISLPDWVPAEMTSLRAGAFVSIHENGELRGCIGTTAPTQKNIATEILHNAIAASTEDPRFNPIEPRELPYLDISVDVLSPFEPIASKDELNVRKYGVIVRKGNRSGLLLPDLDGVDSVDQQISIAKRKAGIPESEDVDLYRFTVTRHS